ASPFSRLRAKIATLAPHPTSAFAIAPHRTPVAPVMTIERPVKSYIFSNAFKFIFSPLSPLKIHRMGRSVYRNESRASGNRPPRRLAAPRKTARGNRDDAEPNRK